ncbi:MAG: TIGR03545 family protein [Elusimicrobia bacterium]|nr:TIGR03545 family protein [Elusimicrobiota bacterium]
MIRKSYVLPRLALLAVVWALLAFALDPLIRWGIQAAGSAALGAKVELASVDTDVWPPRLSLSGFAAADPGEPMRNLVEFSRARFALEGRPLLERKLVIGASELSGLRFGTQRKTSGALPQAPPSRLGGKLSEWAKRSKDVSFDAFSDAKSQAKERVTVKAEDLRSAQLAAELEARWPKTAGAWKDRVQAFDGGKKLQELQKLADEAQQGDPLSRAAKVGDALKRLDEFKRTGEQLRRDLEAEAARARADIDAAKAAKAADLDALRARLQLPSLDPERLSAYLLGPEAAARLQKVLRLVEAARRKMPPKGAPREATPGRGATLAFPKDRSWPAFWLRRAALSGTADLGGPLEFSGEAADFSSEPELAGKPARLELAGAEGSRKVKLTALLDHTKELPRDEVRFEYAGLPMPAMTAGDAGSFAVTVSPGPAAVSGSVVLAGPSLTGTVRYRQSGVTLTPVGAPGDTAARLAATAFSGIKELDVELTLGGTIEEPRFALRSNLGRALADGLKKAVGREAQARLADAQRQIDSLVDARLGKLQGSLDATLGSSLSGLGLGELQELKEKLKSRTGLPPGLPRLFR